MSIEDGIDIRILIDVDINTGLDPDRPNQGIEEIGLTAHRIEAIADDIDLVQGFEEEDIDLDLEIEDIDIMIKFLFYFYFYYYFFIFFSYFFNKIIKSKFIFKYIETNYRNLKKFKNSEIFLKLKDNTNVLNTIYANIRYSSSDDLLKHSYC